MGVLVNIPVLEYGVGITSAVCAPPPWPQLSEAMVRSPWASKWLIKVDDEIGGAGHSFFDTLSIKGAADVLERWVA
jgi:hypothetical protein